MGDPPLLPNTIPPLCFNLSTFQKVPHFILGLWWGPPEKKKQKNFIGFTVSIFPRGPPPPIKDLSFLDFPPWGGQDSLLQKKKIPGGSQNKKKTVFFYIQILKKEKR